MNLLRTALLAVVLLPAMMLAWAVVQGLWGRCFGTSDGAGDVLAGRGDCGRCGCAAPCAAARARRERHP